MDLAHHLAETRMAPAAVGTTLQRKALLRGPRPLFFSLSNARVGSGSGSRSDGDARERRWRQHDPCGFAQTLRFLGECLKEETLFKD